MRIRIILCINEINNFICQYQYYQEVFDVSRRLIDQNQKNSLLYINTHTLVFQFKIIL